MTAGRRRVSELPAASDDARDHGRGGRGLPRARTRRSRPAIQGRIICTDSNLAARRRLSGDHLAVGARLKGPPPSRRALRSRVRRWSCSRSCSSPRRRSVGRAGAARVRPGPVPRGHEQRGMGEIIGLIIGGLIVGALGRLINPGPDPMGWIVTDRDRASRAMLIVGLLVSRLARLGARRDRGGHPGDGRADACCPADAANRLAQLSTARGSRPRPNRRTAVSPQSSSRQT